jgi:hypothetical protein
MWKHDKKWRDVNVDSGHEIDEYGPSWTFKSCASTYIFERFIPISPLKIAISPVSHFAIFSFRYFPTWPVSHFAKLSYLFHVS